MPENKLYTEIDKLIEDRRVLLEACKEVLLVGTILPDDTESKPSVIYGSPSRHQWCKIFLSAKQAIKQAEGK